MDPVKTSLLTTLRAINPPLCVLSTSSLAGNPQSAVMAFAVQDDLSILISTHTNTRKWKNLEENNKAALVFGLSFGIKNVQAEGTAELLTAGEEFKKVDEFYFTAHPELKKYRKDDTCFMKITLTWVRTSDYAQTPPKVEERTL